ncbi:hypothetical protein [Swaminathania salitolerans]|uniref:Uncharacterized protein n=1 Tax=Swaminathania salitolerans TaxID=182838 RepID=A0A511BLW3_9PROT|nr:hypothetical protein [Swaminathania salitolerans]GBQ09744.1 hypothetical protein AA21291_0180 [Swaminathania salitolerans LMG 21291]GEL00863.1 hypothetical protein SSA02_00260 [Swaminathania salitolerans]
MRYAEERVVSGFARVARRLGAIGDHFRVADPLDILGNRIGQPSLCFDIDPAFRLRRTRMWGRPTLYLASDAQDVRIGDIFGLDGRFFFVTERESYRPFLCIACTHRVSLHGMQGREETRVSRCPVSLVMSGRGEEWRSGMPGSTRPGSYLMHMPLLPGVCLTPYMRMEDERGMRYLIDAVEMSQNGIRAVASMQQI